MAFNPNASNLDQEQIIQQVFDPTENRLRVDAIVTATIADVVIHSNESSITIGNPNNGNTLNVQADGSINTNVTLSSGSDSITVVQPTGTNLHTVVDSGTVAVTQATGSNLHTVVDSGTVTANAGSGTFLVDGSAHTQPVSGTVTANAGTGTFTVSGTVTANAGTGTFTVDGSGHTQPVSGTVTANAGTGTFLVDGSAHTQPVSGTVTANAGTGNFTVIQATGSNLHTIIDSGTVTANAGTGTFTVDGSGHTQPISAVSLPLPTGASTSANQTNGSQKTQVVDGSGNVIASTSNALNVSVQNSSIPVTQSGSWSVTANAGTNLNTSALALDTSVNGILVSQGSTTSGEKGPLIQGAVTTSAPSYSDGKTDPLSLTTLGALRTDSSATTQPISAVSLPLPTLAATSTKQSDGSQKTQIVDGSGNVISSNSTGTNNALDVYLPDGNSQTITANFTAPNNNLVLNVNGASSCTFQALGTWSGLIAAYGSCDGSTYQNIPLFSWTDFSKQTFSGDDNAYTFMCAGFKTVKINATTLNSGTANVNAWLSASVPPTIVTSPNAASFLTTARLNDSTGNGITSTLNGSKQSLDVNIANTPSVTDTSDGSVTGGTVASNSSLAGGQFNVILPVISTTQQAAIQLDQNGRIQVAETSPNDNLTKIADILQNQLYELRAIRLAITALATDGGKNTPDDFDPKFSNFDDYNFN